MRDAESSGILRPPRVGWAVAFITQGVMEAAVVARPIASAVRPSFAYVSLGKVATKQRLTPCPRAKARRCCVVC